MDVYGIIFYTLATILFVTYGWLIWDISHWLVKDLVDVNREES